MAFKEKCNLRKRALENSLPGLQGKWVGNGMPKIFLSAKLYVLNSQSGAEKSLTPFVCAKVSSLASSIAKLLIVLTGR